MRQCFRQAIHFRWGGTAQRRECSFRLRLSGKLFPLASRKKPFLLFCNNGAFELRSFRGNPGRLFAVAGRTAPLNSITCPGCLVLFQRIAFIPRPEKYGRGDILQDVVSENKILCRFIKAEVPLECRVSSGTRRNLPIFKMSYRVKSENVCFGNVIASRSRQGF